MVGFLYVVVGPMFSGKTTENLITMSRHISRDKEFLESPSKKIAIFVNSSKDKRKDVRKLLESDVDPSNNLLTSHNPIFNTDRNSFLDFKSMSSEELSDFDFKDYQYISIDEGQFFNGLNSIVRKLVNQNKTVIVSGLIGNYSLEIFGEINLLLPFADNIKFLTARCNVCEDIRNSRSGTSEAMFTYYKMEKKLNISDFDRDDSIKTEKEDDHVVIGGSKEYMAVCREHYEELKNTNIN